MVKIHIFQTTSPFSLIRGVVNSKCHRYKNIFCEHLFDANLELSKRPTGFLDFFLFLKCINLDFLGVKGALCKTLQYFDQNPWRHKL